MRKKWWIGILVPLLAIFIAAGCGNQGGDESSTQDNEQSGATTEAEIPQAYQSSCASCHGGNLEGGFGPALDKIGAKMSKDEISDIIKNGVGSMPPQKNVSDSDRESLAEWLAEQK